MVRDLSVHKLKLICLCFNPWESLCCVQSWQLPLAPAAAPAANRQCAVHAVHFQPSRSKEVQQVYVQHGQENCSGWKGTSHLFSPAWKLKWKMIPWEDILLQDSQSCWTAQPAARTWPEVSALCSCWWLRSVCDTSEELLQCTHVVLSGSFAQIYSSVCSAFLGRSARSAWQFVTGQCRNNSTVRTRGKHSSTWM